MKPMGDISITKVDPNYMSSKKKNKNGYDVFLGGTTISKNDHWRKKLIELLPNLACFDPYIENYTPDHEITLNIIKKSCDYLVFVFTPDIHGVYSIAEIFDALMQAKIVYVSFYGSEEDWKNSYISKDNLSMALNVAKKHGAKIYPDIYELSDAIWNSHVSTPHIRSINNSDV